MTRRTNEVRTNWNEWCKLNGFSFGEYKKEPYWDESNFYTFEQQEVDLISKATLEIQDMCYKVVQYVIDNDLYEEFHIDKKWGKYIKRSFERDKEYYGRLDFSLNNGKLKFYEHNRDTPQMFVESGIINKLWQEEIKPNFNYPNTLIEDTIKYFDKIKGDTIHFGSVSSFENNEDFNMIENMIDVCSENIDKRIYYANVERLKVIDGFLYDQYNKRIETLYKLYPWEWYVYYNEPYCQELLDCVESGNLTIYEPFWKVLLSNKVLLVYLYKMFPESPYLLKTTFNESDFEGENYVKKPIFERQGAGIECIYSENDGRENVVAKVKNLFLNKTCIYQEYFELPKFDEDYTLIGSWVVDNKFSGLRIREDKSVITKDTRRYVPFISLKK